MKKIFTLMFLLIAMKITAQTITYSNFSNALGSTLSAVIADNSSLNPALLTTTGNGVTWDASGAVGLAGYPTFHFIYANPSVTPYASIFTTGNYVNYDPAYVSVLDYTYEQFDADSIARTGSYTASTGVHEIYQDADKTMIFPFNYGQSFTDAYAKTNYSDATTISSYQTGTHTVTFVGFGTLILPQGTFTNVAMISELRTNSLGPNSPTVTWFDINTGQQLFYYHENDGRTTVAFTTDAPNAITDLSSRYTSTLYPNPVMSSSILHINTASKIENGMLRITNTMGQLVRSVPVSSNNITISKSELPSGVYFYQLSSVKGQIASGKITIE